MLQKQATVLERWLDVDLEAAKRFHNNEKILFPKLRSRFCTLVFINFESIIKL